MPKLSKRKLKIGIFTDTYSPQINGVVSSIKIFKNELERQGHEVFIFAPKIKRAGGEKIIKEQNVIRFESFKFAFQPEYNICVPMSIGFIKNYFMQNLDIIHAQTPFTLGILAYYYSYIRKKPLIHTYHTLYPEYAKTYIFKSKLLPLRWIEKITAVFCNRCDVNIAPSDKIKVLIKKYGVRSPIKVLPTGINLNEFKPTPSDFRKKYKISPKAKILIFVGRFGQEKNIDFLIKAFTEIVKKDSNYVLVLVGGGPQEKKLKTLVKSLNLGKNIIFTGYLNKEAVIKAYSASNLFVFASKTETQGMVILEAAACGLPIVAVKDGAFTNVLRDNVNGYATGEDKKDFSEAVFKIFSDKKRYARMVKASLRIAKEFSIERQTKKLLDIYYSLL